MSIPIPPEYAYVLFTFIASFFTLQYLGFLVGSARKKFDVPYPTMYENSKPLFNCVQRGHQNFLESYPFYLGFLFFGGLHNPVFAAIAGAIHLIGRIIFAHLYATGDPNKRYGAAIFIYPSLLYLIYATGAVAYTLLSK